MISLLGMEIPRRATQCARGQEIFPVGGEYYSLLSQNEELQTIRQDFCPDCWELADIKEKNSFPHWKGIVPKSAAKRIWPKEQGARALILLKELLAAGTAAVKDSAGECYILALFLLRRRTLSLHNEVSDASGLRVMLCQVVGTDELLAIPKLSITSEQAELLRQRLAPKLA